MPGERSGDIDALIKALSKIQGFGSRSALRATINLISNRDEKMIPLIAALSAVADNIKKCPVCGNFDTVSPCSICSDQSREPTLCVVSDISSVWALERGGIFKGKYHLLGGILSAINGIEPEDLNIAGIARRVKLEGFSEVILALPATIDAKITGHYIAGLLEGCDAKITELAHGVPIGGELDFLDDGTIGEALKGRKEV